MRLPPPWGLRLFPAFAVAFRALLSPVLSHVLTHVGRLLLRITSEALTSIEAPSLPASFATIVRIGVNCAMRNVRGEDGCLPDSAPQCVEVEFTGWGRWPDQHQLECEHTSLYEEATHPEPQG
jgi:hypothetical protein